MIKGKYRLNLRRLGLLLLPPIYRKPMICGLLSSLLRGLIDVESRLLGIVGSSEYRLAHTGQVCRLRGLLNDAFDPEARRIEIKDSPITEDVPIVYERVAERWLILSSGRRGEALRVSRRGYGGTGGYDFWVEIPEDLRISVSRLRAITDNYKLASKRYAINYKQ